MTQLRLDFPEGTVLGHMPESEFFGALEAKKKEYFYSRGLEGITYPQPSLQDLTDITKYTMDGYMKTGTVDVKTLIYSYAERAGHDERWAARVYRNAQEQKIGPVIDALREHPLLQLLEQEGLLTATFKSALRHQPFHNALLSICQAARQALIQQRLRRDVELLQAQTEDLRKKALQHQTQIDSLTTRVAVLEERPIAVVAHPWQTEAISLKREGLSVREIAGRVDKSKSAVARFLQEFAEQQPVSP